MRKWTKGVMCLLSATITVMTSAFPASAENTIPWDFTLNSQAILSGYTGEETNLAFPDYLGKTPITYIKYESFLNQPLDTVCLPVQLQEIGWGAFKNCGLKSISIQHDSDRYILTIQKEAFAGNQLTRVDIPPIPSIYIQDNAFADNPNLEIINFVGRTSAEGLHLGKNWSGTAKVVFNEPLPEDPPMQSGDTANVAVEGKVEPVTTMNLDVPVTTTFLIDANRDFIAPEFEIVNHSTIPVQVTAVSLTADSGTTAKVVEHDAHTEEEWHNLNKVDTLSQIGLGLKISDTSSLVDTVPSETLWFGAEGTDSNLSLGKIKSAYGSGEAPKLALQYDARYGKLWGNPDSDTSLSYTMVLTFSAE